MGATAHYLNPIMCDSHASTRFPCPSRPTPSQAADAMEGLRRQLRDQQGNRQLGRDKERSQARIGALQAELTRMREAQHDLQRALQDKAQAHEREVSGA